MRMRLGLHAHSLQWGWMSSFQVNRCQPIKLMFINLQISSSSSKRCINANNVKCNQPHFIKSVQVKIFQNNTLFQELYQYFSQNAQSLAAYLTAEDLCEVFQLNIKFAPLPAFIVDPIAIAVAPWLPCIAAVRSANTSWTRVCPMVSAAHTSRVEIVVLADIWKTEEQNRPGVQSKKSDLSPPWTLLIEVNLWSCQTRLTRPTRFARHITCPLLPSRGPYLACSSCFCCALGT